MLRQYRAQPHAADAAAMLLCAVRVCVNVCGKGKRQTPLRRKVCMCVGSECSHESKRHAQIGECSSIVWRDRTRVCKICITRLCVCRLVGGGIGLMMMFGCVRWPRDLCCGNAVQFYRLSKISSLSLYENSIVAEKCGRREQHCKPQCDKLCTYKLLVVCD